MNLDVAEAWWLLVVIVMTTTILISRKPRP